jgi:hypothetical protein
LTRKRPERFWKRAKAPMIKVVQCVVNFVPLSWVSDNPKNGS